MGEVELVWPGATTTASVYLPIDLLQLQRTVFIFRSRLENSGFNFLVCFFHALFAPNLGFFRCSAIKSPLFSCLITNMRVFGNPSTL